MERLFSHLASQGRFAVHPENLATEGLAYVLRRSPSASAAAAALLMASPGAVTAYDFSTQDGEDAAGVPDLVARAPDGSRALVVEAKFWAGLTAHQPVSYLKKLADGAVLAFVVPKARVEFVWNELLARCAGANLAVVDKATSLPRAATVGARVSLHLCTWETALDAIQQSLRAANELDLAEDVRQLESLCARMDADAFLPLSSEDLTGPLWRRVVQLTSMVPEVISRLVKDKVVSADKSRLSHHQGMTGQNLTMGKVEVALYCDADACATLRPTPFWLWLPLAVRAAVDHLRLERPPRLFDRWSGIKNWEGLYVPLDVPLGAERDEVIRRVAEQCAAVATLVQATPAPIVAAPPPASDGDASPAS